MKQQLELKNGAEVMADHATPNEVLISIITPGGVTARVILSKDRQPVIEGLGNLVPRDSVRLAIIKDRPDWIVVKGTVLGEDVPDNAILAINTNTLDYTTYSGVNPRIHWRLDWPNEATPEENCNDEE